MSFALQECVMQVPLRPSRGSPATLRAQATESRNKRWCAGLQMHAVAGRPCQCRELQHTPAGAVMMLTGVLLAHAQQRQPAQC